MKTIYIVFYIFIIQSSFSWAQESFTPNLIVHYSIYYNTENPVTENGKLYVGDSKSLFICGKKKGNKITSTEGNELKVRLGSIERFNYTDFIKDSIFSLDKLRETFLIKEQKPILNWKLENEEKLLDSIKLKKASVNFRGRNYIAWYSEDYPVKFGPWKFNNLPGLIIEIYDTSERYRWIVSSITQKSRSPIPIDFVETINNTQQISIQDYANRRYNNPYVSSARLPRNMKITKTKIHRNGIEIKFEWEETALKKE